MTSYTISGKDIWGRSVTETVETFEPLVFPLGQLLKHGWHGADGVRWYARYKRQLRHYRKMVEQEG